MQVTVNFSILLFLLMLIDLFCCFFFLPSVTSGVQLCFIFILTIDCENQSEERV